MVLFYNTVREGGEGGGLGKCVCEVSVICCDTVLAISC